MNDRPWPMVLKRSLFNPDGEAPVSREAVWPPL